MNKSVSDLFTQRQQSECPDKVMGVEEREGKKKEKCILKLSVLSQGNVIKYLTCVTARSLMDN